MGQDYDYCFFNSSLTVPKNYTLNLQVRFPNRTTDYFAYVWYTSVSNGTSLDNIVGSYQLNKSLEQDGFSIGKTGMQVYIVVMKNTTIAKKQSIRTSYASLQFFLFDVSDYVPPPPEKDNLPVLIITLAVVIGGLIASFCIGIIVYVVIRAAKSYRKGIYNDKNTAGEEEMLNTEQVGGDK